MTHHYEPNPTTTDMLKVMVHDLADRLGVCRDIIVLSLEYSTDEGSAWFWRCRIAGSYARKMRGGRQRESCKRRPVEGFGSEPEHAVSEVEHAFRMVSDPAYARVHSRKRVLEHDERALRELMVGEPQHVIEAAVAKLRESK